MKFPDPKKVSDGVAVYSSMTAPPNLRDNPLTPDLAAEQLRDDARSRDSLPPRGADPLWWHGQHPQCVACALGSHAPRARVGSAAAVASTLR